MPIMRPLKGKLFLCRKYKSHTNRMWFNTIVEHFSTKRYSAFDNNMCHFVEIRVFANPCKRRI